MKNWQVKLGQIESIWTLLITRIANRKSYLVISWPYSDEKLTKSELRSSSSRLEASNILLRITQLAIENHIWSLFAPIHMKS